MSINKEFVMKLSELIYNSGDLSKDEIFDMLNSALDKTSKSPEPTKPKRTVSKTEKKAEDSNDEDINLSVDEYFDKIDPDNETDDDPNIFLKVDKYCLCGHKFGRGGNKGKVCGVVCEDPGDKDARHVRCKSHASAIFKPLLQREKIGNPNNVHSPSDIKSSAKNLSETRQKKMDTAKKLNPIPTVLNPQFSLSTNRPKSNVFTSEIAVNGQKYMFPLDIEYNNLILKKVGDKVNCIGKIPEQLKDQILDALDNGDKSIDIEDFNIDVLENEDRIFCTQNKWHIVVDDSSDDEQ